MASENKQDPSYRVYNFNAGPSALPVEVLQQAAGSILNFNGSGMGVMEMSHRGKDFEKVRNEAEADLRTLLSIPNNYKVLFLQGGGSLQFAQVPLNLLRDHNSTDYLVTGTWSQKAAEEARKYTSVNLAVNASKDGFKGIPDSKSWAFPESNSAYLYYCANETVDGVEFGFIPSHSNQSVPIVADFSSSFLSRPIDVSKFGLIFAGAQKNAGPSGVTVVIVRDDLLGHAAKICPTVMDYKVMAANDSMYNTPPCWSIYMCGLVFKHLLKLGGLQAIDRMNQEKSGLLYDFIEKSDIYLCQVAPDCRSRMNVVFRVLDKRGKKSGGQPNEAVEKKFVDGGAALGLIGLAGHRSKKGIRVSLYNFVPVEAVQNLLGFMQKFEAELPTEPSSNL